MFDMPNASCEKETEKAIRISWEGKQIWIPKSVIHDDSEVYKANQDGKCIVLAWWAEKEKLL